MTTLHTIPADALARMSGYHRSRYLAHQRRLNRPPDRDDTPTVSKRPASAAEGRVNRANIIAHYREHPDQTNREIAKALGLAVSTTAGHLSEIRKARA